MVPSLHTLAALLLLLARLSSSTPLQAPPHSNLNTLSPRQDAVSFACTGDPMAVFDSSCWDSLGMEDYLVNPTTGWNVTTPICDDTSKCCITGEAWTTCYLRLATGRAGWDCLSIGGDDCTWDRTISDKLDPSIRARVRYMTKTIFEVHNFFSKYFDALTAAIPSTSLIITSMSQAIDPQKKSNVFMKAVLSAFTLGLTFLTGSTLGGKFIESIGSSLLQKQASFFATSLANAPSIANTLWPQGDLTSTLMQIGEIETKLDGATSDYEALLDSGLKQLMLDPQTFAKFARGGAYCGNTSTDLVQQKDSIDLALRTYLTSEAMSHNGWFATPGKISTEEEWNVLTDPDCVGETIHGCMTPEAIKPSMFWSPQSGRQYRLWNIAGQPSGSTVKSPAELMQKINEGKWGDLAYMFDGAYNCTLTAHTEASQLVKVDLNAGVLDLSCISALSMKRECTQLCPVEVDPCPFERYCTTATGGESVHGGQPATPDPDTVSIPAPEATAGKKCVNGGGMSIHGGVGAAGACQWEK